MWPLMIVIGLPSCWLLTKHVEHQFTLTLEQRERLWNEFCEIADKWQQSPP